MRFALLLYAMMAGEQAHADTALTAAQTEAKAQLEHGAALAADHANLGEALRAFANCLHLDPSNQACRHWLRTAADEYQEPYCTSLKPDALALYEGSSLPVFPREVKDYLHRYYLADKPVFTEKDVTELYEDTRRLGLYAVLTPEAAKAYHNLYETPNTDRNYGVAVTFLNGKLYDVGIGLERAGRGPERRFFLVPRAMDRGVKVADLCVKVERHSLPDDIVKELHTPPGPVVHRAPAVGLALRQDAGKVVVDHLLAGSPAALDGRLQPGDEIVAISSDDHHDWREVQGQFSLAHDLLKGAAGTKVSVRYRSPRHPLKELELTRQVLSLAASPAELNVDSKLYCVSDKVPIQPAGAPFWLSVLKGPEHGKLNEFTACDLVYSPEPAFRGTDGLTLKVCDADGCTDAVTVTLHVGVR